MIPGDILHVLFRGLVIPYNHRLFFASCQWRGTCLRLLTLLSQCSPITRPQRRAPTTWSIKWWVKSDSTYLTIPYAWNQGNPQTRTGWRRQSPHAWPSYAPTGRRRRRAPKDGGFRKYHGSLSRPPMPIVNYWNSRNVATPLLAWYDHVPGNFPGTCDGYGAKHPLNHLLLWNTGGEGVVINIHHNKGLG